LYKHRNKTFIYGIYEHFTVSTPTVVQYAVPDANFRGGNFSEILGGPTGSVDGLGRPILQGQIYDPRSGHKITAGQVDALSAVNPYGTGLTATQTGYVRNPIAGNILANLPGYVPDPVGAKLLSYYPCPTCTGVGNNYTVSASAPAQSNEYSIRADQNISDSSNAYFRYAYKQEEKTGAAAAWGSDAAGPGNQRPNDRWGMWAGLTHVFSPTFTMNITSGVQIWHETSDNQSFGFNSTTGLGLPSYLSSQYPLFPIVDVGSVSSLGPLSGNQQGVTNHGPIGTVAVDLIKVKGKDTLNVGFMGVEQEDSQKLYYQTTLDFSGNFTAGPNPLSGSGFASGNGVAQMLLGVLDSAGGGTSVGTIHNLTVSNRLLGTYVQDDWRPTHNLTLNLGLRYEMQTPDTYRNNEGSVFDPNALNPVSYGAGRPVIGALEFLGPGHRDVYNPNYTNIAPRVGFSYQAISKAVVHGGYGIFFPQSVTCCFPADPDGFSATTYINPSLNG
jgi:hypothetical protein